jgi:pimeloyl-ACP methyl ester carboxylesterase
MLPALNYEAAIRGVEMFDYVIKRANADPNRAMHCAFGPLSVELNAGDLKTFLTIDKDGARLSTDAPERPIDLNLRARTEAWAELISAVPKPGYQTLSTMRRTQNLVVTGDMVKFQQHLLLLEMLFSNLSDRSDETATGQIVEPVIEPVTGRYLQLQFEGRPHRVYFEEAGQGVPLICLHTAGSDGRQFRHLLNDPEVTDRFRVMGCSIGGRAVLHLALRHGESFRAAIGLQSALYAEDRSLGDKAPDMALHRPDIHGGKSAGALMAGMIAPQSPPTERWETMWHYMQGGPGVFMGDLHYYFTDGDLRNGLAEPLRESPCPLYLLSGEYDASATPEMGQELAELIGAEFFQVMRGVGHFPMSENPTAFRGYLLPVLDKIMARGNN